MVHIYDERKKYSSSWGNASERAVQTYADFYAHLGYSSIQFGLNTAALKGFNQVFADQALWNDAERQIYTEIMARDTLTIERLGSQTLKATESIPRIFAAVPPGIPIHSPSSPKILF